MNYSTSARWICPATDLFRRLHWKNVRNQKLFAKAIMMFKILNGETPDYLSNNQSSFVMILLVIH